MKKRNSFIKYSVLFLSFMMLFMVLFGCGKTEEDDDETESESIEEVENEDVEEDNPYYGMNDGLFDFFLAKSVDSYLTDGFSSEDSERLFFIDEIRKSYKDQNLFTIDFTDESSIISKEMSGDLVTSIETKGPDGKNLKFEAKNLRLSDSGELIFTSNSCLTLLTEIEGISYVAPKVSFINGSTDLYSFLSFENAFCPSDESEVDSSDKLLYQQENLYSVGPEYNLMDCFSNLGFFKLFSTEDNPDEICISELAIRYSGNKHGIDKVYLDTDFYGYYAEDGFYNSGKEIFDLSSGTFDFYLVFQPDSDFSKKYPDEVSIFGTEDYVINDLYDTNGNVKSKDEKLSVGDYLMVDVKGSSLKVELPVYPIFHPENLYASMPASNVPDLKNVNVLVIPYYFEDQEYTEEEREHLLKMLGRVSDFDGNVTVNEADGEYFTFSDYYEKASYGNLNLTSFVTDSYKIEGQNFEECRDMILDEYQISAIQDWVNENYAGNIESFDQNSDGIFDAVVLICDEGMDLGYFSPISNAGAVSIVNDYNYDHALTDGKASFSHYVVINADKFHEEGKTSANVLIHEFGHQIGLIDYYDVTYSGINAVGHYDMQSDNTGDWNPYSKFAAGWIKPMILNEEAIGSEITVTLNAFSESGDTVIIPVKNSTYNSDGSLNPFNEYIMIDLFSPTGVNEYDAQKYGLTETGIRMYHVDSNLVQIPVKSKDGEEVPVGDYAYNNSYSENGMYCIETIQKSGVNTFTDVELGSTIFCNDDLFYPGDSFSLSTHSSFFTDGVMDNKEDFPYVITVLSIDGNQAQIKISR